MKSYTFKELTSVSDRAVNIVTTYLQSLQDTLDVVNVEDVPIWRKRDVDLIRYKLDMTRELIEVKGDRYYETGNYYIETISNFGKTSTGCFFTTKANYIFYCFIPQNEIHIIPINAELKEWFRRNLFKYPEKTVSTKSGQDGLLYTSRGYIVPRQDLMSDMDIKVVSAEEDPYAVLAAPDRRSLYEAYALSIFD